MEKQKTNYRNVFKSDHLGSIDLEEMKAKGQPLIFTIKEVRQEKGAKVAGRKIDANIAYWTDKTIKPMVLNATNSKQLSAFADSIFVEDWAGLTIELYIERNIKFGNDIVEGIRISPKLPKTSSNLPELKPGHERWDPAKQALKEGKTTIESIQKHFFITEKNIKTLCG